MTAPSLVLDRVRVRFGALSAIDDVDMVVESGTIHGVIGPNGAGKSSLFNAISGVYRLEHGSIRLDDVDLARLRPHRIAALGVARSMQNVTIHGDETVRETLMVGRHRLLSPSTTAAMLALPGTRRAERRGLARVGEIAAFTGIVEALDRAVRDLPYGLQKIVDVTRAICMEPRLLLLDEPAAGLDTAETRVMRDLIRDVRDALDITIVVIEHDMDLVMSICDRITVLDFGRRVSDGSPHEVSADPAVVEAYLGTGAGEQERAS